MNEGRKKGLLPSRTFRVKIVTNVLFETDLPS